MPTAQTRPPDVRTRRRLSRTLSRARWGEYRAVLQRALDLGYTVVGLEDFLRGDVAGDRILILRHDVDQCPRSALRMLAIERRLGVHATWYFRWRTARARVIERVRRDGGQVGLHYETLTRAVFERGHEDGPPSDDLVAECREQLKRELVAFSLLFGPTVSACAHGDTRVPGVSNLALLTGEPLEPYGLQFDANLSMRRHSLAVWLTDRSGAEGGWRDGIDPIATLETGASPILLLTHPNNWISGMSLWRDRLGRAILPSPSWGALRALRSGTDAPPSS